MADSQVGGIGGIGFVLSPDDPYCIVDLSGCRNPETGEIEPWARGVIDRLNSYTELSPSGLGVHIILRGRLPGSGRSIKRGTGKVQLRGERYFFTMTGQHMAGTPTAIRGRKRELSALYFETYSWGRKTPQGPGPSPGAPDKTHGTLSQEELMQLAGTMRRQGHGEADILVNLQALNRASVASLPESTLERIARSAARKPPGLTWKGDPWAAVQAIKELGGQDRRVKHMDLKKRIMENQKCGATTAREAICKAVKAGRIGGPKNDFKGYKIRGPSHYR